MKNWLNSFKISFCGLLKSNIKVIMNSIWWKNCIVIGWKGAKSLFFYIKTWQVSWLTKKPKSLYFSRAKIEKEGQNLYLFGREKGKISLFWTRKKGENNLSFMDRNKKVKIVLFRPEKRSHSFFFWAVKRQNLSFFNRKKGKIYIFFGLERGRISLFSKAWQVSWII